MPDLTHAKLPALTLTIEDHGTAAVVHLHGKLVAGSSQCLEPVAKLTHTHKRIVLDLKELTHMDSMGLGSLLRLYISGKTHGCTIELRNLGNRVRELMVMTNLLPIFNLVGEQDLRM